MTPFFAEPEKPLTDEEKLLADVIQVNQRIPCGCQIGLPLQLDQALDSVEQLFTEQRLPLKDELLAALRLWKAHAEQGLTLSEQCDVMMQKVIRSVDIEP